MGCNQKRIDRLISQLNVLEDCIDGYQTYNRKTRQILIDCFNSKKNELDGLLKLNMDFATKARRAE